MTSRLNEFAFKIATVNGTGSASANGLLMQSIFRMGIPVGGKNLFPSNIQGLQTWYEIRVSSKGHLSRTPEFDLMVAMNPATYAVDIEEVVSGGYVLHDSTWPMADELRRDDVHFLGVPFAEMCRDAFTGGRARILMKNIAYVGALAALFQIDMDVIRDLLQETFSRKPKLIDSNFTAVRLGYDYALEHFDCPLPTRLEAMEPDQEYVLMDGNTALALGCVFAGATVGAWYPITPATSVMDGFINFCARFRTDPETGERRYMIVQAEDELAAAGIVIGAGWAGARAFTPTSGPGISLMSEFIGLAYYAEIPSVFVDVQRTGPSTGMPTRTQQGDLLLCAYASHGDTKHICLYPADPHECFEMAPKAFDLAERFQTPVFLISDLDIGMNDWRTPKLTWDDSYQPDRGKVLSADDLENIDTFYRYLDVDGDGIAARTLPGVHPKGAYFTRGSGHDKYGRYTEDAAEYLEVVDRIARKIEGAAEAVPEPFVKVAAEGSRLGIITIGGCHGGVMEALHEFAEEGLPFDYLRVRGFPFGQAIESFLESHDAVFVVEQNRDAQLLTLLTQETACPKDKLISVLSYSGLPMNRHYVMDGIRPHLTDLSAPEPALYGGEA